MTASFGLAALVAIRLWALLRQQVLWREVCGPVWEACAAAFGLLVALGLPAESNFIAVTWSWPDVLWLAGWEFVFGTVLGALVSLPGHAVLGALQASGQTLGISPAAAFRLWGSCMAALCGVALGLHRPLLVAVLDLQAIWPVGQASAWLDASLVDNLYAEVVLAGSHALLLSLSLATPVLLCAAVFDLTQRLVSRGAGPWLWAGESLRVWLVWATSLLALAASWAAYPGTWGRGLG